MSFNIRSALKWWTKEIPDQVAVCFDDETITYQELNKWSDGAAQYLLEKGLVKGDRIGIVAPNTLNYLILAFAAMKAGIIYTPLNFRSAPREIKEYFHLYQHKIFFCDAEQHDNVKEAISEYGISVELLSVMRELKNKTASEINYMPNENDPVFVIGTSGSTGKPKGVIYNHKMIMSYAAEFGMIEPRCAKGSKVLSLGPFSSSSGSLLLMQFIALGTTLYIDSKFCPLRALKFIRDDGINTFQAAPVFFERIAALPEFTEANLSSLYFAQVGGAPVSTHLLNSWHEKGVTLRQAYGSTEAGGGWAARDDAALSEPGKCGRGGIFTEYAILATDGKFAEPGQTGEILVRGPSVSPGYWNNKDETEAAFKKGWFHSGDLGYLDKHGNLTFVGRIKEIIISGGLNVSAAEVESVIRDLAEVDEVVVIPVKDDEFGETPLAIIYSQASLSVDTILSHCKRNLSGYKVPRYIELLAEPLPRLPSGKLAKFKVKEMYQNAEHFLKKVR